MNFKGNEPTEGSILLNSDEKKLQETPTEKNGLQRLREILACPPRGLLVKAVTNGMYMIRVYSEREGKSGSQNGIFQITWLERRKKSIFNFSPTERWDSTQC